MPRRSASPTLQTNTQSHVDTVVRVRYAETDQMGIVYYANYLVWFEVGRGAFCRERGIDYKQMERDGLGLPTVEARCRYLSPARFDDEITIRTWTTETRRSLLTFHYEVWHGETLLATGETRHFLLDRDGKPRSFPPDIAARFSNTH